MKKISCKVLYSDLHLRIVDPLGFPTEDGLTTRIHDKLESLSRVIKVAIDRGADEIIDLGDLFSYLNPPDKLRNAYARVIRKAMDAHIKVTRVLGNHETDGKEGTGWDAGYLAEDTRYQVVSNVVLRSRPRILFIPEVDKQDIISSLSGYPEDFVVGHFGVNGAQLGSAIQVHSEIPPHLFTDREYPTFLGHIHRRQVLCRGKVVYIGALCRNDFGDMDIPTGCCVILIEYEEDTGIIDKVTYEFVPIFDIGLKQIVIREKDTSSPEIEVSERDIIKVVYEGSYEWFSSRDIRKLTTLLKKSGASKVFVLFKPLSFSEEDDSSTIDFEFEGIVQLIKNRAMKDGKNPGIGLQYLEMVESERSLE